MRLTRTSRPFDHALYFAISSHIRGGDRNLEDREIDSPPERPRPLPVTAASVTSGSTVTVSECFVKVRLDKVAVTRPLLEYGLNH